MSSVHPQRASKEAGAKEYSCDKSSTKSVPEMSDKKPLSKTPSSKTKGEPSQGEEEEEEKRDVITGRVLSKHGGSCLRCTEKGLNCTLNFVGVEGADKCAACQRSGAEYCIRELPAEKFIPFRGPPWNNPNYFSIGANPSPEEMKEILREHFQGKQTYCNGEYVREKDLKGLALPPFNGVDLPLDERMENWMSADWKRVLPTWRNASHYKDLKRPSGDKDTVESDAQDENQQFVSQDTLDYFRVLRKYQPRNIHLQEYQDINKALGETW